MKSKTVLVAFVVMVLASIFTSQVYAEEMYCGRRLVSVLALVCGKESNPSKDTLVQDKDVTRGVNAEKNIHSRLGRKKRSVHEECCVKPCHFEDLLQYC
ncbi:unnamed protein product [Euphydryas editha]|uniref:Insulin-like domain-containing protein n=1 Tax=Euphydryas editha TaxID=104508 RepID=A0AAU9UAZ2_EUPED|nr:unnamed protein product [Euphydryas editha]